MELQRGEVHGVVTDVDSASENISHQVLTEEIPSPDNCWAQRPTKFIVEYLLNEVLEYWRLSEHRRKVWKSGFPMTL